MAEMSDAEVFGTKTTKSKEMSDADVFGPAKASVMSDADVFGPSGNTYVGDIGRNVVRGAVESAVVSPLRGLAGQIYEPDTSKPLPAPPPGGYKSIEEVPELPILPVAQSTPYRAAEAVSGVLPQDSGILNPVVRDVASGFGSVFGNIGTALIPGVRALTIPSMLSQGAGEATERAVKASATEDQIRRAASFGNVAGATEFLDLLLLNTGSYGKAYGLAKRVGLRAVQGAFIEGGQEGLQQFIQNSIAKGVYKPEQALAEDVAYNALIGGIVGGGVGSLGLGERPPTERPPPPGSPPSAPPGIAPEVTLPAPVDPQATAGLDFETPEPPLSSQPTAAPPSPVPPPSVTPAPQATDPAVVQAEIARLMGVQTDYRRQFHDALEAGDRVKSSEMRHALDTVDGRLSELYKMLPKALPTEANTLDPVVNRFLTENTGLKLPERPEQLTMDDVLQTQQASLAPQMPEIEKTPRKGSRESGTNPRALGTNPRAEGTNPRALGGNPRNLPDQTTPLDDLGPQASSTTIQATPGANAVRLAKLLSAKLYGDQSSIAPVSVKEMFQNAYDAIKGVLDRKADTQGNIGVTMDRDSRTISVSDDGSGMTPEVLGKQFLEIAGTKKETERASGGLGIAKMLFLFGNKSLNVKSMRDGKVSEMSTTGPDLLGALGGETTRAPRIQVRSPTSADMVLFPKGRGTVVTVNVPETYIDETSGETKSISFEPYLWDNPVLEHSPLFDNINVTFNGQTLESGAKFPADTYTQLTNVRFPWGSARVYITKEPYSSPTYGANMHVLSNGLWQFSTEVKQDPLKPYGKNIPFNIYVDVSPTVSAEDPAYPFDLNRQRFSPTSEKAFSNLRNYLSLVYGRAELEASANNFGTIQFLDYDPVTKRVTGSETIKLELDTKTSNPLDDLKTGTVSIKDGLLVVNGREIPDLTPEEIARYRPDANELRIDQSRIDPDRIIAHGNTEVKVSEVETRTIEDYGREKFGRRFDEYIFGIGAAFRELRNVVVRGMPRSKQPTQEEIEELYLNLEPGQVTPTASQIQNAASPYAALGKEGIGVSFDPAYYGVSIRLPFAGMFINPLIAGRKDPIGAAVDMVFTMVHELAHHKVRGHDARFPEEMQQILVMLDTHPTFSVQQFKQKVVNIVAAYEDVFKHMNGVYTSGDFIVRPSGRSLKDTSSKQAGDGSLASEIRRLGLESRSGESLRDWYTASQAITPTESRRGEPAFETSAIRGWRPASTIADNGRQANYNAVRSIDPGITAVPQQPEVQTVRTGTAAIIEATGGGSGGSGNMGTLSSGGSGSTPNAQLAQAASHADRFNWMYKYFAGLTELINANPYFKPLVQYGERARQMHSTETGVWDGSMRILKEWRSIGVEQSRNLNELIKALNVMEYLSPVERAAGVVRHPTDPELVTLAQKYKVESKGVAVYRKIRRMDDWFMGKVAEQAIEEAKRRYVQDPQKLIARINEINAEVAQARSRPFFPFTRFGRYYVNVKDASGKVVHFETFEPKKVLGVTVKSAERYQEQARKEMQRKVPPGHIVDVGVLPETAGPLLGLPTLLLQQLQTGGIGFTQDQIDGIKLMQGLRNPAMSLSKRSVFPTSTVGGTDMDLSRAFAKYYFHGGRYLAKVSHAWALRGHIAEAQLSPGNKAGLIASYMSDHLNNTVLDARGDFGFFKGAIFLWAMGYVPAAATQNLTQTPMITLPFLGAKFGDFKATKHLVKSIADVTNYYKRGTYDANTNPNGVMTSQFEMRALDYGIKTGRISETQASELAGLATGGNLITGMGGTKTEQAVIKFQEGAAWMFEMAEQFNRRVAYRAALRLAQENPNSKFVKESLSKYAAEYAELSKTYSTAEAASIVTAINAVDQTQYVYARYARPRFMRGPVLSTLFVFKRYMQATLWMLGNNKADVLPRYLVIAMLMGGLGGVPGYEDMKSIFRAFAKWWFGKDVNVDRLVREYTLQWFDGAVDPGLITHGLARKGFGIPAMADMMGSFVTGHPLESRALLKAGFEHSKNVPLPVLDRSRAITMGNILPFDLGKLMEPTDKLDRTIAEQTQKASGAVFSVGFNMYKALMDQEMQSSDPKRWEKAMPRAMGSVSKAFRVFDVWPHQAGSGGRERGKGGPYSAATIIPYDVRDTEQMMEVLAMGMGYQPLRQQAKWDYILAQAEVKAFYDLKRKGLLEQLFEARHSQNPDEVNRVRQEIIKYNRELPDYVKPRAITSETIQQSMTGRERARQAKELGVGTQKSNIGISREMQRLFPEATIDVRRVR